MAPGSHCMSGNTYGCRMSWTYHWAVMVPRIKTRGGHVLQAMAPHTITQAVGAVCHCKAKNRIEAFTMRFSHTNTIVITAEIESGFFFDAKDDLVPFCCSPVSSCVALLQTEASMGGRQGQNT
ncbi:hypothetical protein TNCV_1828781 [Trichonephila clavipes]|nr:hypothetical protein TNCV_1828781 [Trichonephila clavipes]